MYKATGTATALALLSLPALCSADTLRAEGGPYEV